MNVQQVTECILKSLYRDNILSWSGYQVFSLFCRILMDYAVSRNADAY